MSTHSRKPVKASLKKNYKADESVPMTARKRGTQNGVISEAVTVNHAAD